MRGCIVDVACASGHPFCFDCCNLLWLTIHTLLWNRSIPDSCEQIGNGSLRNISRASWPETYTAVTLIVAHSQSCTLQCGSGRSFDAISCRQPLGASFPLSYCGIPTLTSLSYLAPYTHTCHTEPCLEYRYVVGEWGPCSPVCGTVGVQTRFVGCYSQFDKLVQDSYCYHIILTDTPARTQPCPPAPCPAFTLKVRFDCAHLLCDVIDKFVIKAADVNHIVFSHLLFYRKS